MYKITEIFKKKKKTLSFEFFPPKTEEGIKNLFKTCEELSKYADFFSVTYSPDGSSKERTLNIAYKIQKKFNIPVMVHLTCINHTEEEIKKILDEIEERNIKNILALRGDVSGKNIKKLGWKYASQLVKFIRENYKNFFSIGVACYPEGNNECRDRKKNVEYLKIKVENGADFAITQLFFSNENYFSYVNDVKLMEKNGKKYKNLRIIPGIYPLEDYQKTIEFCNKCGAIIPEYVHDIFKNSKIEEIKEKAKNFTINQCKNLLEQNAPGLHFFTLNKAYPTKEILEEIF